MNEDDDGGEKSEEPSQYRLEEYRSKGQVASSKELTSVLLLFGTILTLILSFVFMYETIEEFFYWVEKQDFDKIFVGAKFEELISKSVLVMFKMSFPILVTSFLIGILSNIMQVGFIFAPDVISFKFERLNPIAGLQRLFSMKMLYELLKTIGKLAIVFTIVYVVLKSQLVSLRGLLQLEVVQAALYSRQIIFKLSFSILVGLAVLAILDFAWEKYSYRRRLFMTKQQAKEESKQKEGNPEIKQRIRAAQRELSRKRMMADVPKADVVISNPTHISVALKYDQNAMLAPKVLAKGADEVALKIREIAREHDVPIVENISLARTIYKTVKVGEFIPRDLYKVVAQILGYVYKLRKQKRLLGF